MTPRFRALAVVLLAFAGAVTLSACGEITKPQASLSNTIVDSVDFYALNGSPVRAPTALDVFSASPVRADVGFNFDIAFDIDSAGRVVLMPVRTVASGLAATRRVGLQEVATSYDALTLAPASGYHYDSTLVVTVGSVVAIQSTNTSACSYSYYYTYSTELYAKIQIRAVDPAKRTITARLASDPNCGYRSLTSGIPKS